MKKPTLYVLLALNLFQFRLYAQSNFFFGLDVYGYRLLQDDHVFYPDQAQRSGGAFEMTIGASKFKEGSPVGWVWESAVGIGSFNRKFDEALSESLTFNCAAYSGVQFSPLTNDRLHLHTMGGISYLKVSGQKPETYEVQGQPYVIYYGTDPTSAALAAYFNQLAQQPHLATIQGIPAFKRFALGLNLGARFAARKSGRKTMDLFGEYLPLFSNGVRHEWRAGLGWRF